MKFTKHLNWHDYIVYENGNIWSEITKRFLKLSKDKDGYLELRKRSGRIKAHRLIAECFIDNPLSLPMVNHKNGVKFDNRVENLEWVTAKENSDHAYFTGLLSVGEDNVKAILTEDNVKIIRLVYKIRDKQYSCAALARIYGVSEQTIRDIIKLRTWKHLLRPRSQSKVFNSESQA